MNNTNLEHSYIKARMIRRASLALLMLQAWASLSAFDIENPPKHEILKNDSAYLPPQCYTVTEVNSGAVRNTCYTCHTESISPNMTFDQDLQLENALPEYAETNRWSNLLEDRTDRAARIGDREILTYIRESNYFDSSGRIAVAERLSRFPSAWDHDGNGSWSGFVPDCYFQFDKYGFDRDRDGEITGWRAFGYYPFPSTHWPANGGISDVMIRLPRAFRRATSGAEDLEVYRLNLAILEALIKRDDVAIPATEERRFGVDLNANESLDTASVVRFNWAPLDGRYMYFVGEAGRLQRRGDIKLAAGLFPVDTEFLQTVRYPDPRGETVGLSPRIKEIRYARKIHWYTYAELETLYLSEIKERSDFPDRLKLPVGNFEDGVTNGRGWVLRGYIEDSAGELRPQSKEETTYCIGCHGGVGVTNDSTFSFGRKLDSREFQEGWFHWSQKDLTGINEPKVHLKNIGVQYEYSFYLMYAKAGDEFAANREVVDRFFDSDGYVRDDMATRLHEDISLLLYPSHERSIELNKVYKTIVDDQSFILGREPVIGSADLHDEIEAADAETGVSEPVVVLTPPRDFPGRFAAAESTTLPSHGPKEITIAQVDGLGMSGPSGERYGINWQGLIDESTYGITTEGVSFTFPPRHTLPTRIIVPNSDIPGCYTCHRLMTPMPDNDPQVTEPVTLSRSSATESGTELTQLTSNVGTDINAQWSPDGRKIAWESDRSGEFQIWVMNADGTGKKQVSRGPAKHGWPMWSPDGTRLVYWGYTESTGMSSISTSRMDGTGVIMLVETDGTLDRPEYRPDGNYVAYAAEIDSNWDIYAIDVRTRKTYRLTHDAQMETNPLWSPDGNIIAYKVAPNKEYNLTIENFISVRNGLDNPSYYLWDGTKSIQMNAWSPDGTKIAYTAEAVTNTSGEDRVSYLAVVDDVNFRGGKTSGTPVVLSRATLGDRGPVFSPDGNSVAFWAWDAAYRATLWMADVDGSNSRQITTEGSDMYPRFSPDGGKLAFESARSGNMDIWVATLK